MVWEQGGGGGGGTVAAGGPAGLAAAGVPSEAGQCQLMADLGEELGRGPALPCTQRERGPEGWA